MRVEELVEYAPPKAVALTQRQLQQFQAIGGRDVSIAPRASTLGVFDITANVGGGLLLDGLQIRIRPRFGIRSSMFLIA